jgi:endonuclease YncB( thermonuclease family)
MVFPLPDSCFFGRFAALSALFAVLLLFPVQAFGWSAKVIYVQDGDSLIVKRSGGGRERVRLYGVDCPEYKQPWGEEARKFTAALVRRGSWIKVTPVGGRDSYKRVVAIVRTEEGAVLQEELLKAGLAWVYGRYCRREECSGWLGLEREARKGRGLWQDPAALPPWIWKRAISE